MRCVRRVELGVAFAVVLAAVLVIVAPSPRNPGTMYELGLWGEPVNFGGGDEMSWEELYGEASELAQDIYGIGSRESASLANQMLGTYYAATNYDILLIFNSGGWGWSPASEAEGWGSIIEGVAEELRNLGYSVGAMEYQRTTRDMWGPVTEINEILASAVGLPMGKAQELAARIEFLLNNIPGVQLILLGESNGASICEYAFRILSDSDRVYTIQTGPPFWHGSIYSERSLVMRSNGEVDDCFSNGDIFTLIGANLSSLLGVSDTEPGAILYYVGAPGHEYSWSYPEVAGQIIDFLRLNFGAS